MAKNITLKQLRYFLAAAEAGRFSVAALHVHVTQSAITNAVLALEKELGVRLFQRLPQGVTLTADGHSFYRRTRDILDALDDTLREPRFQAHGIEGEISLAASYTLLGYFLPALMARFRTNHPNVAFDLSDLGRQEIERAVTEGEIDLGVIILSNSSHTDELQHHVLVRSRRQLWTAEHHPILKTSQPSLADIATLPYIQITVDESEASTDRYWSSQGMSRNVAFRTSSMEALRDLIAHGFGVTILSDMVYRPWSLEGKKINALPMFDAIPPMEVGLIWKRDKVLDDANEAFRQFLIQACGS